MRKSIAASVLALLAVTLASAAEAKKDKGLKASCQLRPSAEWLPIQQITEKAKALGYDVWKVDQKRGCWEIKGYDKNGASIKASFDPTTGQIVSERDMLTGLMGAIRRP
jgi:hypothetical protein